MNSWKGKLGLDGSVAYTFLARVVSIVGSTGMVLLITHFLSPVEQGYYYALISLVSLQMVFELGFSFVVQQLAAHECVHLELRANGSISGDAVAHARLASTLQLCLRWYTLAAVLMGVVLAPIGLLFFSRHAAENGAPVAWLAPWLMAVTVSMVGLWLTPYYSILEGCGHVRAVAALRLRQAAMSASLAWLAMLLHHGLYAPTMVIVGQVVTGAAFLVTRRGLLLGLLRHPVGEQAIHWNREVWPFQWRIGVSWMCSYFTVQVFIPIIFMARGAVEAGKMGMTLSITGYMTGLVLPWISTKATPFGHMIARREFQKLDHLFLRTLGQSMAIFGIIALAAVSVAALLPTVAPRLAMRMVSPWLFAVLVCASGANCTMQGVATLLRSFKREPFLVQSLAVATLTLLLALLTARHWGNTGAALSYLFATGGVGLPSAYFIFMRARKSYLTGSVPTVCGAEME